MIHYGDKRHHSVFYFWVFYFLTVSSVSKKRRKCIKSVSKVSKRKKFYEKTL